VASTDYSGDLEHRRQVSWPAWWTPTAGVRNALKFLLANVSDFDPGGRKDAVPVDQLLEIDRYALARAAQLQADILAHFKVYEFHPVVSKLQVRRRQSKTWARSTWTYSRTACTPPPPTAWPAAPRKPRCGRSPKPMPRWMAPFLSFTAEEAWAVLGAEGQRPKRPSSPSSWTATPPLLSRTKPCWSSGPAIHSFCGYSSFSYVLLPKTPKPLAFN